MNQHIAGDPLPNNVTNLALSEERANQTTEMDQVLTNTLL
jgi:hypothetical protein